MLPNDLSMQMMLAMMNYNPFTPNYAPFAPGFPNWNANFNPFGGSWPNPNQPLNPFANLLKSQPPSANPVLDAMQKLSLEQSEAYLEGLNAYLAQKDAHSPSKSAVIWQRGSARLLDYAPHRKHAPAVLCVPSLINKSYILDLYPDASLIGYLKSRGFRPLLLDWGAPSPAEEGFDCSDYVQAYALDALSHLREDHDGPISLLGYCMGGVFALAMAQLAPISVDGLILLATPWDFASADTPVVLVNPASQATLRQWFGAHDEVPPWVIQSIFFWMNPFAPVEKMSKFNSLSADEKKRFAAIEHWAYDSIAVTGKIAEECFVDWPQGNILATHRFHVGRKWIDPQHIACDTLVFAAKRDKIVPIGCASPLAKSLRRATLLTPDTGHVGMVAGARAKSLCWQPMADWLDARLS